MSALVPQPSSRSPRLIVEIVTPERVVVREEVGAVSLPTPEGMISILPQHIAYVGALAPGAVQFRKDGDEVLLAVSGGVVEVRDGVHVRILADTAERAEDIDVARAEEARKRAVELRQRVLTDDQAFAGASAAIEKELARLRAARRTPHRGHHGVSRGTIGS